MNEKLTPEQEAEREAMVRALLDSYSPGEYEAIDWPPCPVCGRRAQTAVVLKPASNPPREAEGCSAACLKASAAWAGWSLDLDPVVEAQIRSGFAESRRSTTHKETSS
jgi:hypothetical protein